MGSIVTTTRVDKATGKKVTVHRAHVRRKGYASKSKVFLSLREARDWLRDNEAAVTLARKGSGRALAQVIEDFVDAPPKRGTRYWSAVHLDFWKAQLGALRVGDISRGDINDAVAKLQRKPALRNTGAGVVIETEAKLSPATVNRYLASLSSVFNYCMDRELIDAHPMKGGKVKKLPEAEGRRRILDASEEQRLYAAARACPWPSMYLLLRMLLTTGARRSEVLKLRWHQVRLDESIALLGKTKNGKPRALPLVADVRDALREAAKVKPINSDLVFFDEKDPEKPKNIDSLWRNVRAAAGLLNDRDDPLERVVLHSTRHTAVTKMLRGGANLAQAARVSGHQTLAMLKKYEHLAAQDAVDIAQKLLAGS
jgi:integrase